MDTYEDHCEGSRQTREERATPCPPPASPGQTTAEPAVDRYEVDERAALQHQAAARETTAGFDPQDYEL